MLSNRATGALRRSVERLERDQPRAHEPRRGPELGANDTDEISRRVERLALGKFSVGADNTIVLGPPTVFNKANIAKFNF